MSDIYNQVRYWVDDLPKLGRTTFSVVEAEAQFGDKTASSVRRALSRLVSSRKIQSVWKGFYAVTLPEYGRRGIIPPIDYIDQLMRYLGKGYYVALLSAAACSGASHQAAQVFQIISDGVLHKKSKNGTLISPAYKKRLPHKYIIERNSRTASVKFSSPELTALDLLLYQQKAGGLNHVATVLSELSEVLDFRKVDTDFFEGVPAAAIQRLGFLLEFILDEPKVSDGLYEKALTSGLIFRYVPLAAMSANDGEAHKRNTKWKIIENYLPESDL
jgi:hypothetical protein